MTEISWSFVDLFIFGYFDTINETFDKYKIGNHDKIEPTKMTETTGSQWRKLPANTKEQFESNCHFVDKWKIKHDFTSLIQLRNFRKVMRPPTVENRSTKLQVCYRQIPFKLIKKRQREKRDWKLKS